MDCYVFFPHLPLAVNSDETFLSLAEQREWVDDILVPALRRACPFDVLQHSPRSFQEVVDKSEAKREFTDIALREGSSRHITFQSALPSTYLESFWSEVLRLCTHHPTFHDPFLWISGHDLKCLTKQRGRDVHLTMDRFFDDLRSSLHWDDDEFFPPEDAWYDFGVEDTPCGYAGVGAREEDPPEDPRLSQLFEDTPPVCLRKTQCLGEWEKHFEDPASARRHLKTQSFAWALTRDAGARTFSTTARNTLRASPGIAHGKSYNVIKDFSTTPLKRAPFSDPRLEGLCFTQATIDELSRGNSFYGRRPLPDHRAHGQTRLVVTRDRLLDAMVGMRLPCGVRQEYRIRAADARHARLGQYWQQYRVDIPDGEAAERLDDHLTYWIVPASAVAHFLRFELLRWQAGIETISAQTQPPPGKDANDVPLYTQIANGVMLSALLRIQTLSAGSGDPSAEPALWKSEWMREGKYNHGLRDGGRGRARTEERSREDAAGSSDDTEETSRSDTDSGTTVQGLGVREALEARGMCWIREDLIQRDRPAFREDVVERLALAANRALRSFRRQGPRAHLRQLRAYDTVLELFREKCIEWRGRHLWTWDRVGKQKPPFQPHHPALRCAAQLVIAAMVEELWRLLSNRLHNKPRHAREIDPALAGRLTHLEVRGLRGLDFEILSRAMGRAPHVAAVKPGFQRGPNALQYRNGSWVERVSPLFRWMDRSADVKARAFDDMRYRHVARSLHAIIGQTLGAVHAGQFEDTLCAYACRYLLVAPNCDLDHFCPLVKGRKGAGETLLQRSRFTIATIPRSAPEVVRAAKLMNDPRLVQDVPKSKYPSHRDLDTDPIEDARDCVRLWTTEHDFDAYSTAYINGANSRDPWEGPTTSADIRSLRQLGYIGTLYEALAIYRQAALAHEDDEEARKLVEDDLEGTPLEEAMYDGTWPGSCPLRLGDSAADPTV